MLKTDSMNVECLISKRNSLILKGVGIMLMLIHHLFYLDEMRPYYDDIIVHGHGVVNQIGLFSKLCVAVFVFVSGYGLAVSTPKDIKLKDFYWHRLKKLYLNYWFIWLLFVPIGVFVFGRTLMDAYGDHVALKGILDFFGLLKMFGIDSYNPTWWFYSCIIILYLLFPLLNRWLWSSTYLVVSVALTIGFLHFVPGINVIAGYLFVFLAGILLSRMPLKWGEKAKWWHFVLGLMLMALWRMGSNSPKHIVDAMLCVGMALLIYKLPLDNWIGNIFAALGEHSMNMFLTHSFIFYFWFSKYIYITRNPLLIFLSLTISTYLLSVGIEWLKRKVGFYKLI